ncbi:MAG: DivIVA family protein [Herbinix sp.]|jgi:cell division initiation protein|nr:DivIVA family protein [Herbinix sp.]
MFTPSEIKEKAFKTGIGYDKKDVEQFINELSSDFEALVQDNNNLKKNLKDANESLGYYKSIEKTLQRALILAEKTAQDTKATAFREAEAIQMEAKAKANLMLADSIKQIEVLEHKTLNLMQQYDMFKIHFENLLHAQIELLNSKSFSVNTDDFLYKNTPENSNIDITNLKYSISEHNSNSNMDNSNTKDFSGEDQNQIHFNFLPEPPEDKSYHTEDGFEFFTMKDE